MLYFQRHLAILTINIKAFIEISLYGCSNMKLRIITGQGVSAKVHQEKHHIPFVNNVSSTNSEQSKLCINGPLYIDAWLLWEQAIGSNGP